MLVLLFLFFLIYSRGSEGGGASPRWAGDSIYGRVPPKFTAPLPSTKAIWAINHTLNQLPCHHTRLLSISSHSQDGRMLLHEATEAGLLIYKEGIIMVSLLALHCPLEFDSGYKVFLIWRDQMLLFSRGCKMINMSSSNTDDGCVWVFPLLTYETYFYQYSSTT